MSTVIRKARPEDAKAFLRLKSLLPMPRNGEHTTTGGFLLGTDEATYLRFIRDCHCLVAEHEGQVVGFGIALQDSAFKESDIWQRRGEAQWLEDITPLERQNLGYVEQMAFLHGHRRAVIALAYSLLCAAFEYGAQSVVTATVHKPVLNLAAVPLILAGGGRRIGRIDEVYPLVGQIVSDIYLMEENAFWSYTRSHPLHAYFEQRRVRL